MNGKESDFDIHEQDVKDPQIGIASGAVDNVDHSVARKITRISSILTVLVSGLALFSDGYNAQIIGYMEPLFSDLYPNAQV
jgi:hypothetical protein